MKTKVMSANKKAVQERVTPSPRVKTLHLRLGLWTFGLELGLGL